MELIDPIAHFTPAFTYWAQLGEVINTLEQSTKPIVAAVDGLALGGQDKNMR